MTSLDSDQQHPSYSVLTPGEMSTALISGSHTLLVHYFSYFSLATHHREPETRIVLMVHEMGKLLDRAVSTIGIKARLAIRYRSTEKVR